MSEVVGEAVVRIRSDESGVDYDGAGKRAGKGYTRGFGSSLKGLGLAIGGALAAAGAANFVKGAIGDAREAQKVTAATGAIIEATGGAAKVSEGQIADLSGALAAKTGVDDAQIQAGQNLLLTFKNVKREGAGLNDVFGRATRAGLDLAAAGFGSVEGNAKQLGKALNDPIKGIAALSKSGVTFTDQQKAQIETLVGQNDLLGAQKIILGEVEAQVGGTAAATATAGEKSAFAFGELKEQLGTLLLPLLDRLADTFVTTVAPAISTVLDNADKLGPIVDTIGGAFSSVFGGAAAPGGPLDLVRQVVGTIGPILRDTFAQALPVVEQLFGALAAGGADALPVVAGFLTGTLLPALSSLFAYVNANVVPVLVQVGGVIAETVIPALAAFYGFVYGQLLPAVVAIVTQVASNLRPVLDALIDVFVTRILPTFQRVVEQIRTQLVPALQPLITKVIAVVGFLLRLASAVLGKVLPPLIQLAGFLISKIVPVVVTVITFVARFVNGVLNLGVAIGKGLASLGAFSAFLITRVVGAVSSVVSAITGLPGRVIALGGRMLRAGGNLIGSLLDGMRDAASGVGGIVGDVADAIFDAVKGAVNSVIDLFNKVIPDKISIPGPIPDVNLPNNPIPRLQQGTQRFGGGLAMVGEQGRELVGLPAGARVFTATRTRQLLEQPTARPEPTDRQDTGAAGVYIGTLVAHDYDDFTRQTRERSRAASLGGRRPAGLAG